MNYSIDKNEIKTFENYQLSKVESNRINCLKTILIFFVLFIHNKNFVFTNPIFSFCEFLFSDFLSSSAVPLFFFLSGYLQELNERKYSELVKKRTKTILLPYFIWSIICILIKYFLEILILNNSDISFFPFLFKSLTGIGMPENKPFVYQFWFLRDLFILILLYPLEKKLLKSIPFVFFLISFIFLYLNINLYVISNVSLCCFFLGMFFGSHRIPFFQYIDKIKIIPYSIFLFIFSMVVFYEKDSFFNIKILKIFFTSIFLIRISLFVNKKKYVNQINKYSFFIYCGHEPFLMYGLQILERKIFCSEFLLFTSYFFNVFLVSFILIVIGILLKRIVPCFYSLLTGGRV